MNKTTKTAQFTPGPWHARRNHAETTEGERINITAGSKLIAETHHAWVDWEEQEANATLIAAAPAMYDALREAEQHLTDLANYGSEGIPEPLLVSVRSAIAQAEGR